MTGPLKYLIQAILPLIVALAVLLTIFYTVFSVIDRNNIEFKTATEALLLVENEINLGAKPETGNRIIRVRVNPLVAAQVVVTISTASMLPRSPLAPPRNIAGYWLYAYEVYLELDGTF